MINTKHLFRRYGFRVFRNTSGTPSSRTSWRPSWADLILFQFPNLKSYKFLDLKSHLRGPRKLPLRGPRGGQVVCCFVSFVFHVYLLAYYFNDIIFLSVVNFRYHPLLNIKRGDSLFADLVEAIFGSKHAFYKKG